MDLEGELVDQAVWKERPDELAAAQDHEILVELRLEPRYGVGDVAGEKHRVGPRKRLFERGRGNIFLGVVQGLGERLVVRLVGQNDANCS